MRERRKEYANYFLRIFRGGGLGLVKLSLLIQPTGSWETTSEGR